MCVHTLYCSRAKLLPRVRFQAQMDYVHAATKARTPLNTPTANNRSPWSFRALRWALLWVVRVVRVVRVVGPDNVICRPQVNLCVRVVIRAHDLTARVGEVIILVLITHLTKR
jgi:hypothetical protein